MAANLAAVVGSVAHVMVQRVKTQVDLRMNSQIVFVADPQVQ